MALIMCEFVVKFMLITIHILRSSFSGSLSKAISLAIVISRMSILEAVIMALVMCEFMVEFMLITIYILRSSFSGPLSKAISLSIIISRMSVLEAVIMALIVSEFVVEFLLISINCLCFSICCSGHQTQSKKRNQKLHDVSCFTTRRTHPH